MKVVVFGAGGIGAYLGAMLSRTAHEVTLVCRGAHLAAIQAQGLQVRSGGTSWRADRVRAVASLAGYEGHADVVLDCVKLYDLEASAEALRPVIGPQTLVMPIQNGVSAHEVLGRRLPPGCIVPGTVFMSSHVVAPGVVELKSESTQLTFGELDGRASERTQRFHAAGLEAGYQSVLSPHILQELWRKFVVLNAVAPLCGLSRQPVGVLREDPTLRALMVQSMREVMAVAAGNGIALGEELIAHTLALTDRRDHGAKVSLLEDLEAGRRLELEWICGFVSQEGRRLGVATPIADLAYACLRPSAQPRAGP